MREEIMAVKKKMKEIEDTKETFYMEILNDYKRSNKAKDILIFVLLAILLIIVAGAFYIFCTYDFSYEEVSTKNGSAVINKGGDTNAESNIRIND